MRRLTTAAFTLAALLATAVPAAGGADGPAASTRIAGDDRYQTAAELATAAFESGATDTVIIASGEKFPDGLASSYLAGVRGAAVLLSPPDLPFPQATLDAIDAVGASKAIIAGGRGVISQRIEDKLVDKLGEGNVERISGRTRIETAVRLAAAGNGDVGTMPDLSGDTTDELRTAVVATAENFPDALAMGPVAYAGKHPLLLTDPDELSDLARFALEDNTLNIEQVIVVGGPGAVSNDVLTDVRSLDNIRHATRIAGSTRTETAAAIAALARSTQGWDGTTMAITTGATFPDALALAPLAATRGASVLLTASASSLGAATFQTLQQACTTSSSLIFASGPRRIPNSVVAQAELASQCADRTIALTPQAEPQGGEPGATGSAWLWHDPFCYAYTVEGVTGPIVAAHIHEAPAGQEGQPVATLDDGNFVVGCIQDDDVTDGSSASSAAELNQQIQDDPAAFYVNLHTERYPAGVVRGQLG